LNQHNKAIFRRNFCTIALLGDIQVGWFSIMLINLICDVMHALPYLPEVLLGSSWNITWRLN